MPHLDLPVTEPILVLAVLMLVLLVVPMLSSLARLPSIVGLLLAGVVIGPNGLGILERDQTMILLGTVGLLYIMFIAGLEIDLNEFHRRRHRSAVFGALTFTIPQTVGTVVGLYLLEFSWPSSILLASMFASHTLLAYPAVSRLGLAKNEAVTVAVGGTIITDTLALLVLAVVARSTTGALGPSFWLGLLFSLTVYTLFMFVGVPRIGRWFFRTVDSAGVTGYVFVLTILFVASFLASVAGVEPLIGAFFTGLALNRLIPERSALMNRTEFIGSALFIPFFLISVGMLVDVRVFFTGSEGWLVAVAMVVTVSITKWLAAYFTQLLFGYSTEQRTLIYGLSVPQAAATLAAVLVGYQIGLLSEAVLNGTIVMILATCLVGSWLAEDAARKLALQEEVPLPSEEVPAQRILVPVASPETVDALIDLAIMVRERYTHEPVRVLSVLPVDGEVQARISANEKKLAPTVKRALAADVPVRVTTRLDPSPATGILRALAEIGVTHVIAGWVEDPSASARMFGSILDRVLAHSTQMIWVCRLVDPLNTMRRVVVVLPPNVDHEPRFGEVLHTIKALARQMGVPLHFLVSPDNLGAVQRIVTTRRPPSPATFEPYSSWPGVTADPPGVRPEDLLVLVGAREQTISWRSDLDRAPATLASHLPTMSLIVAYPPLLNAQADTAWGVLQTAG